MKKLAIAFAATALTITSTPAMADPPPWAPAHGYRAKQGDDRINYRYTDNDIRYWRGRDGQYYCRKNDGTVGLLAGAALGALLGRAVDTRGERATGTILGAAAGALLGRELTKGRTRCR